MDEILSILREETAAVGELARLAESQRQVLRGRSDARAVSEAAKKINRAMEELDRLEREKEALLEEAGAKSMAELLKKYPYSAEKREAKDAVREIGSALKSIKEASETSAELVSRGTDYLTFSMNLLAGAKAGPGYDAADTPANTMQGRKFLDESV